MFAALVFVACQSDPDPTRPEPTPLVVDDLSWSLHPEVRSLVEVGWSQSAAASVRVEYRFDGGDWASTPAQTYAAGDHTRIVVGIPYETEADWRVVAEGADPVDGNPITTGFLSANLPRCTVVADDPTGYDPEQRYLLTSINEENGGWTGGVYWTFILDRQCRVIWASRAPDGHWTLFAQRAPSGDAIYWDEATYWSNFDGGARSTVHHTWLDAEIAEIPTPGLHHAFLVLPDGTLVWGSQDHGGEEALVEKAPGQDGESVVWTCADDWPGSGRCESNGLFYVPETDRYLYSFYTNSSVVEVDRAAGTSAWWAGQVADGYTFDPPESQFAWQHGISYTDAGTLLVSSEWDGGDGGPTETWLLEYAVDEAARTLRLVWSDASFVRADTNGQAWRLANGNTLHILGSASEIREVTPDHVDVWRVDFDGTRLLGAGEWLTDLYPLLQPAP